MNTTFQSILNILGFFGSAFVISLIINSFLLKFAHSLGIRHKSDVKIRWSNESKPALGGVSFYICFLIGFMFYAIIFGRSDVFRNPQLLGLFFGVTLAFLLGLSDDAYDTKPKIKLAAQILCGVILVLTNSHIQLFPWEWLNYTLTIVWVIGIMNSINMLDNMDGITTVTSISIILAILGISIPFSMTDNVNLFLMITILGALAGFLTFNWNPAKMFMGDTGSQFLGFFLAFFSIRYLWNNGVGAESDSYSILSNLTLVLITFCIPIIDTTYVVIKRIRRGQSPMIGGRDHTTHTLSYKGMSDSQVAYTFVLLGIVSCLLALNVAKYIPVNSLILLLIWGYVFALLFFIFRIGKEKK
ncbi:MAG: undecaprenyl/decaprenyl-phosphate alpha-N-acetylglucosaminyl 1-phosphate transferase [Flavobacteriales bacterium]|jgi:UDP-GlcNAc:undecaprenyl-phosphate GlcNAc-1-phosphate transferase|nr:undecaprenyl/decaprenyl-phosphate alpha-N-acetylglucosaminyl 1-phosphate transferase [Flavobacteriales bacterium]